MCQFDPSTVVTCEGDAGICKAFECDPKTGNCDTVGAADSTACDDGDACTVNDTCSAGVCVAGDPLQCGEDTTCANNWCDPVFGGCVVQNTEAACNDDDTCTQGDGCYGGECLFVQNICPCTTVDDCGAFYGKCEGIAVCTEGLGCGLEPDSEVICGLEGDTPCAFDGCNPDTGTCGPVVVGEGEACDDNDACTINTACGADGSCVGEAVVCDDGNPCTDDFCDPNVGCVFTVLEDGVDCDDGDACKVATKCSAGVCTGGGSNPACKCLSGLDSQCAIWDDADKCNGEYQCVNKKCLRTDPVECPVTGLEPCKYNACDPFTGSCSLAKAEEGTPCEDGDPCTEDEVCGSNGQCSGSLATCCAGNHIATCGSTLSGETAPVGKPSLVDVWPCYADFNMDGPETIMSFTAPCDGTATFHYDGPAGSLLFGVREGDPFPTAQDACLEGACESYSPSGFSAELSEGETMLLVIDLWSSQTLQGVYELETLCDCAP